MQDEARDLPAGWVRQYDGKSQHQFFVDTKANPPRSIWHHPYDDDTYLKTLSTEERERIEQFQRQHPSREDIIDADSDVDDPHHEPRLPPYPATGATSSANQSKGSSKWGRKMKDKLTGTTHEQRELERQKRHEEEEEMYRRHLQIREAMAQALQTGKPAYLGKDRDGHDVYIEPPYTTRPPNLNGRYYDMYGGSSPYSNPSNRFVAMPPAYPYNRPYYGGGYQRGGMGMPIAGGLLGGALLGGLLF